MSNSTVSLTQREIIRIMTALERYANYARDEAARCAAADYQQGVKLWQSVQADCMVAYEKVISSA